MISLIGGALYLICRADRLAEMQELSRLMFWTGLLAWMLKVA